MAFAGEARGRPEDFWTAEDGAAGGDTGGQRCSERVEDSGRRRDLAISGRAEALRGGGGRCARARECVVFLRRNKFINLIAWVCNLLALIHYQNNIYISIQALVSPPLSMQRIL